MISDEDLKTIKPYFTPQKKDDEKIEICTRKSEWLRNTEERSNALFGYLAWNLGDKKIFCPVTANNIKASQIKEISSKCFPIEGKDLQKMHESYISSQNMTL